jgi:ribosomal-protein-alanine N-acetyltransferase
MGEDDLEEVLRIETLCSPSPWTRAHFAATLESPLGRSLVARRGGRPVAFVCGTRVEDEAEIQNLAVSPQERRRGIGAFLLALFLERVRREGCRRVFLEVRASNEAALRLYSGAGFERVGRRAGYYSDPKDDAVLMAAVLDDRDAAVGSEEYG